jgi:hypothetical protein
MVNTHQERLWETMNLLRIRCTGLQAQGVRQLTEINAFGVA